MRRKQEKLDGTYVSPIEKKALAQQEKEARQLQKESERQERAKLLQNESAAEKKKRMREEKAEREECKRQKQAEAHKKKMADQAAKDEFYATFANIQRKKKLRFGHSIRTDGVSARLLYYKEHHKNGKIDNTNVPKRGLYTIDEIKHMSRLREDDMCVIGIDPGKHDLIYAVGDNYLTNSDHRLRYSSAQRRTDRCSTFYAKCMQREKSDNVVHAERELAELNSRSSYSNRASDYFRCRRTHLHALREFYSNITYRIRRWRTFQKDQKSIAGVINGLKRMVSSDTKVPVLAYGSWARASATFNPKGIAPCIGIGLRRRLSKEFIVVDTPEHYTSKTCSKCYSECGPFVELETQRRKIKEERANTEDEKKRASLRPGGPRYTPPRGAKTLNVGPMAPGRRTASPRRQPSKLA